MDCSLAYMSPLTHNPYLSSLPILQDPYLTIISPSLPLWEYFLKDHFITRFLQQISSNNEYIFFPWCSAYPGSSVLCLDGDGVSKSWFISFNKPKTLVRFLFLSKEFTLPFLNLKLFFPPSYNSRISPECFCVNLALLLTHCTLEISLVHLEASFS